MGDTDEHMVSPSRWTSFAVIQQVHVNNDSEDDLMSEESHVHVEGQVAEETTDHVDMNSSGDDSALWELEDGDSSAFGGVHDGGLTEPQIPFDLSGLADQAFDFSFPDQQLLLAPSSLPATPARADGRIANAMDEIPGDTRDRPFIGDPADLRVPKAEPWSHVAALSSSELSFQPSSQELHIQPSYPVEPRRTLSTQGQSSPSEWRTHETTSRSSIGGQDDLAGSRVTVTGTTHAVWDGSVANHPGGRGHDTAYQTAVQITLAPAGSTETWSTWPGRVMPNQPRGGPLGPLESASSSSCGRGAQHDARAASLYPDAVSQSPSIESAISQCPDPLPCDDCGNLYSGEYRRGNLSRHRRQKHGQAEQLYPCEAGCGKTFRRQDARLKHYRRQHPHLAPDAPVPRPH